ncbi:hypothetical protein C9J27_06210 [Photobacterium kishitanii]|uniref:Uncharacterized protein n=1 Tax=Photobacterium kishitanii TaxID=318456 RepID=A0A2T3KM04_9GAMM|nr:hypothetical protein C9J27_06210 [Photobacterium kishitanii]
MINFEFSSNLKIRLGETNSLPIMKNNRLLYFMIVNQENLEIVSYNCDINGLNNLHHCLKRIDEDCGDNVLILCNWHGVEQSHTFVCDKSILMTKVLIALGSDFCDELCSGLSY